MKAMQTGKGKVYHKAVNVGFYGSLFHQGTSAICSPDLQGLIGFTSYHDLFLCCVMRSVAALVIGFIAVPLTIFIISDFTYIVNSIFTVFINYFTYILGNKKALTF